jgi:hypothetical protein
MFIPSWDTPDILDVFTPETLDFLDFLQMKVSDYTSLDITLSKLVHEWVQNSITVVSIVTDNARNLKRALDFDASRETLEQFSGQHILRFKCTVHNSHLALREMQKFDP